MNINVRLSKNFTTQYNKMLSEYGEEFARLNGLNYGVSTQVIGIAISELYRDPKDLSVPYRLSKNFDNENYTPINILEVPKYTSPYTAFMSQNFDDALVSSCVVWFKNETMENNYDVEVQSECK